MARLAPALIGVTTLAAASALAGCAITDAAAVPGGQVPSAVPVAQEVYLNECGHELVSKPGTFTLTCADAGQTLQGLTWTGWSTPEAVATGTEVVNLCTPTCVAGRVVSIPVEVRASRLVTGKSAIAYTQLTVTVTGRLPAGLSSPEEFTLDSPDTRHTAQGGQ